MVHELLEASEIEYPLQVNGKVRGRIKLPAEASREEIEASAMANPDVLRHIDGRELVRLVVVPGKLVNIVVRS